MSAFRRWRLLAAWLLVLPIVLLPGVPASAGPRLPAVTVIDESGRPWKLDELVRDRPVLLGFFFTYCTKVCPVQTAVMREARESIRHRGHGSAPLLLSVSLQPITDTPQAIRSYASTFEIALGEPEGWLMVTGKTEDLRKIWSAFGEDGRSPDEHPGRVWIGRADGSWREMSVFSSPTAIADALLERP